MRLLFAVIAAFCISYSANAAIYHVDPINGDDDFSGLSWQLAFETFQKALTNPALDEGDSIWVAIGTYKPGALQSDSFIIPLEVKVFGGFPIGGGDGTFGARIPALFEETILSGDIDSNDFNSPAEDPDDINGLNSFHVVTIINVDELDPKFDLTHVDGFMITAGNANNPLDDDDEGGGGAYIIDQDPPDISTDPIRQGPLFRNCIFQGNRADRVGGAIAAVAVGLEVRDCQILNNECDGGGISGTYTLPETAGGGGIAGIGPMIVVNSTLIGNICTGETIGAPPGVYAYGGGLNVASWHADNNIAVASCFFASNEAQDDPADTGVFGVGGGAVVNNDFGSEVHVMNCVFVKNVADNNLAAGGGMSVNDGVQVTLCTFYANSAPNGFGGGLVYGSAAPSNCIAWNNTDAHATEQHLWRQQTYGTSCPTWSNIQDWNCSFCPANPEGCGFTYHNICADPDFVDPDGPAKHTG